jgi:hypothetical protein
VTKCAEVEGRIERLERLGVYREKRREKAMSSIQHCMRGLRGRSLTRQTLARNDLDFQDPVGSRA